MPNIFYAFRSYFKSPGAPPRDIGIQSGMPSGYGINPAAEVSFDSAMQISAVWAAVKIISESIGSMPLAVYRKGESGRVVDTDHALSRVLTRKPNIYQTPVEFWESMTLNLALSGNAYAVIQRDSSGDVIGLLPVSSAQIETNLLADGTVTHTYITGGDVKVYSSNSMWHVKLFGNGIVGLSPLSYARNSIGIAIASDNRVSKIYSNGAKPSGILTIDRVLQKEQRAAIRANFSELEEGNQDKLFVLEAGMEYKQVSMTPQDIQLLDSRRFQIEDVGRFFGVPSILLNQTFGQSSLGSNVYEIFNGFYKLNLRPYLEKFESSVMRWLFNEDASKYEVEFDFDALLRADTLTRMQGYREAINSGQMTPNEARQSEGRQSREEGDEIMIQGAMVPMSTFIPQEDSDNMIDDVQHTALNGAQVTSLQAIIDSVAAGMMPSATAAGVIAAAFPAMSSTLISEILKPLEGFEQRILTTPARGGTNGTQKPTD